MQAAATALPDVVMGQRKQFTAFSHEFQFASVKPIKGGKASLGLALTPDADPRLETPKNEAWSERLKSKAAARRRHLVDASVKALMKAAWQRSEVSALNGEYSSASHSISCSKPWRSCKSKRSTGPRSAGSAM